jgi:hypothetical protein
MLCKYHSVNAVEGNSSILVWRSHGVQTALCGQNVGFLNLAAGLKLLQQFYWTTVELWHYLNSDPSRTANGNHPHHRASNTFLRSRLSFCVQVWLQPTDMLRGTVTARWHCAEMVPGGESGVWRREGRGEVAETTSVDVAMRFNTDYVQLLTVLLWG